MLQDRQKSDKSETEEVVKHGPWLGRDGFVAETAVRFDRVTAAISRLERDAEKSRKTLAGIAEESEHTRRFRAFEETLRNGRDHKITQIEKANRTLRSRLDAIEGNRKAFQGLSYGSLVEIDARLKELAALQRQVDTATKAARFNAILFGAALALAVAALATHFV